jgi:RNA polymerase sigma-70 factor (ECF subfamily)
LRRVSVLVIEEKDRELVERSLRGDEQAFAQLVGTYQRILFNLAYRMVNNREDARDLTQTVFLKVYRNLGGFDHRRKFFSWVYRIMINECLNCLNNRRPQERLSESLVGWDISPMDRIERRQTSEIVQRAIMRLSPEHREAIILRHFVQLSHREMSELLRIPEKTMKSRLYSARQRLGRILQRQEAIWA